MILTAKDAFGKLPCQQSAAAKNTNKPTISNSCCSCKHMLAVSGLSMNMRGRGLVQQLCKSMRITTSTLLTWRAVKVTRSLQSSVILTACHVSRLQLPPN